MIDLETISRKVAKLQLDYDHAHKLIREEKQTLKLSRIKLNNRLQAQKIIQQVAQTVQQQAHTRISAVVTKCLAAVFPNPYTFKICFEQKRGKTEARLVFVRDGREVHPTAASGLGVVDVAAFAQRLASLKLSRPIKRQLLVLDEPFSHVSRGRSEAVGQMIQALAEDMKIQIILITHNQDLEVGKVIRL